MVRVSGNADETERVIGGTSNPTTSLMSLEADAGWASSATSARTTARTLFKVLLHLWRGASARERVAYPEYTEKFLR